MSRLSALGLGELQVFDAIHRCRSVVDAAQALDLPQPTASRWLAKLREHFGDQLFVRTSHGMEPTAAAEALATPVREILQIYRDRLMQERAFDPATTRRNFRLAASDFGQLTALPALDAWALDAAPFARFTGVPLSKNALPEELETGAIDIAIGGFPGLSSGIVEQTLYEDQYVCMLRRGHPLAREGLSLEAFQASRHVVVSARAAGHVHQEIEDRLIGFLPTENVRLVSSNFSLAPMLIAERDYVLTLPRRVAALFQEQLDLAILAVPLDLPRFQVKQYWHERSRHDPGHRWLREGIAEVLTGRLR
ncbi:MAG: LysR-family transcriptional regulator [Bradyrhizobium sp.]|nr:LysR-family transcriptional regulator [Bradyrhizobium sp.]